MKIFEHVSFRHKPRNANAVHDAELRTSGINTKIAIALTRGVGSMWTAYAFAAIAFVGLLGIVGVLNPTAAILVGWASQTLIQLVLLPVIMVGQNVLGRKAEIQSDEQFNTTTKTYHDIEQIIQHLNAQDEEAIRQSEMIKQILSRIGDKT